MTMADLQHTFQEFSKACDKVDGRLTNVEKNVEDTSSILNKQHASIGEMHKQHYIWTVSKSMQVWSRRFTKLCSG